MLRNVGKPSKFIALLIIFTLVFVAGCQSVSNVDFNSVLKGAFKVNSSESKGFLELKLQVDDSAYVGLPAEEIALMKLLSSMRLQLDSVKTQDSNHMSLDGKLVFGENTSIKFGLKLSDQLATLDIEGAKQPFVIDMTGESLLNMYYGFEAEEEEAPAKVVDEATLTAIGHQMLDTVGSYVINNLPNPDRIVVNPTVAAINGVNTSLMHVHVDLNGKEIWGLFKKYVDALVADRAGLDKMLSGVLQILSANPDVWEAAGMVIPNESGGLDQPTTEEMVKEAADEIASMLEGLQSDLKEIEAEDLDSINEVFNEQLTIKADLYVDSKLDIRKQAFELSYAISEDIDPEDMPLKGVTIKVENESWNINGTVKADAPVASKEDFPIEQLASMQGFQVLKKFDEKSAIYDLLKNKLHINKQSIVWYSDDYYNPPIVTANGITIIPLRDTVEELGAELIYEAKTKSLKIIDEATNNTMIVKIGSDAATVNGKAVKLSFPIIVVEGAAYIPARDFAKVLGAKISWTDLEYYDDVKVFKLEREV